MPPPAPTPPPKRKVAKANAPPSNNYPTSAPFLVSTPRDGSWLNVGRETESPGDWPSHLSRLYAPGTYRVVDADGVAAKFLVTPAMRVAHGGAPAREPVPLVQPAPQVVVMPEQPTAAPMSPTRMLEEQLGVLEKMRRYVVSTESASADEDRISALEDRIDELLARLDARANPEPVRSFWSPETLRDLAGIALPLIERMSQRPNPPPPAPASAPPARKSRLSEAAAAQWEEVALIYQGYGHGAQTAVDLLADALGVGEGGTEGGGETTSETSDPFASEST